MKQTAPSGLPTSMLGRRTESQEVSSFFVISKQTKTITSTLKLGSQGVTIHNLSREVLVTNPLGTGLEVSSFFVIHRYACAACLPISKKAKPNIDFRVAHRKSCWMAFLEHRLCVWNCVSVCAWARLCTYYADAPGTPNVWQRRLGRHLAKMYFTCGRKLAAQTCNSPCELPNSEMPEFYAPSAADLSRSLPHPLVMGVGVGNGCASEAARTVSNPHSRGNAQRLGKLVEHQSSQQHRGFLSFKLANASKHERLLRR